MAMKKNTEQKELEKSAERIMKKAKEEGISTDYLFDTTFKRYKNQIKIMEQLEEAIEKEGAIVEKSYTKGKANIYANPAIAEYNKTATAANGTAATLLKILATFSELKDSEKPADFMSEFFEARMK